MWKVVIIAFVVTAAYADYRTRRIPRALTITAAAAGLAFHGIYGGIVSSLEAAALAFVIGLALFSLGAIGGGDVKLITALGAMMGLPSWAEAMEVAIFVAAAMALFEVIRHRALRQTLRNMADILGGLFTKGLRPHPSLNVSNPGTLRSPFGMAAAIGTIVAMIR
jgi:prepilin peptidase CpaA